MFVQVIILIGNKADLEAQRDVTYEEAKQFAEENGERSVCRSRDGSHDSVPVSQVFVFTGLLFLEASAKT